MMLDLRTIFVFLFACVCINCVSTEKKKPQFIIDNDAGADDAMAIFLALLYEKHFDGPKLLALTTGNGNTNEDNVCYNNQRILRVARRQDVPIYRGSKESLVTTPPAKDHYGKDGLGDSGDTYPDLVPARNKNAVNALIDYSRTYEGDLTVITIGTLTNIALAMKLDPGFLSRLNHLYIGAGHIHSEKYPNPQFNALVDVEAYYVVAQNATPDKVTVFPSSQDKEYLKFSRKWRENELGAIDTDIIRAMNRYEKLSLPTKTTWQALDPATVSLFLRPDLVAEYKYSKNNITLCGDKRGITTHDFVEKEKANVRIAYSVKREEYKEFLLKVFGSELNARDKSKNEL